MERGRRRTRRLRRTRTAVFSDLALHGHLPSLTIEPFWGRASQLDRCGSAISGETGCEKQDDYGTEISLPLVRKSKHRSSAGPDGRRHRQPPPLGESGRRVPTQGPSRRDVPMDGPSPCPSPRLVVSCSQCVQPLDSAPQAPGTSPRRRLPERRCLPGSGASGGLVPGEERI